MESGRAIAFFEEILDHIKKGETHFEHAGRSIDLTPGEAVEMKIEVKHKDGKQKLEFELLWKEDLHREEMSEEGIPGFKVSPKKEERTGSEQTHEHMDTEPAREPIATEAALF
jgi:amphi-Trp domain-containing protein